MIYDISSGPSVPALKAGDLVDQAIIIYEAHSPRIETWQALNVDFALVKFRKSIPYAVFRKVFARIFSSVTIAINLLNFGDLYT